MAPSNNIQLLPTELQLQILESTDNVGECVNFCDAYSEMKHLLNKHFKGMNFAHHPTSESDNDRMRECYRAEHGFDIIDCGLAPPEPDDHIEMIFSTIKIESSNIEISPLERLRMFHRYERDHSALLNLCEEHGQDRLAAAVRLRGPRLREAYNDILWKLRVMLALVYRLQGPGADETHVPESSDAVYNPPRFDCILYDAQDEEDKYSQLSYIPMEEFANRYVASIIYSLQVKELVVLVDIFTILQAEFKSGCEVERDSMMYQLFKSHLSSQFWARWMLPLVWEEILCRSSSDRYSPSKLIWSRPTLTHYDRRKETTLLFDVMALLDSNWLVPRSQNWELAGSEDEDEDEDCGGSLEPEWYCNGVIGSDEDVPMERMVSLPII